MEKNDREGQRGRRCAGLGPDIDGSPMRWDGADELTTEMKIRGISFQVDLCNVARRGFNFSFLRCSVRKTGEYVSGVKLVQSSDCVEQSSAIGLTQRSTDADIFGSSK